MAIIKVTYGLVNMNGYLFLCFSMNYVEKTVTQENQF